MYIISFYFIIVFIYRYVYLFISNNRLYYKFYCFFIYLFTL